MPLLEKGKRKLAEPANGSSRAKKGCLEILNLFDDGSEFGSCLVKSGAQLLSNSTKVQLEKDQIIFRQLLTKSLKLHLDYPKIIDESVKTISNYIEEEAVLKAFLNPVMVKSGNDETTTTQGLIGANDSFLKTLLSIDVLQPKLMDLLLDKIVILAIEEEDKNDNNQGYLSHSIVKQFCWLDAVLQPQDLVSKLFDTIKACPSHVQKEVILNLPEILEDGQHPQVARHLIDLMTSEPHLLLTIVDSLDNLNLPHDCLLQLKQSVIAILPSADVEKLPVVLKFLFQHVSGDDAVMVVQEIRKNIKLEVELSALPTSTPRRKVVRKKEASKGAFAMVVDVLKSSIRFHKIISNAWIKVIDRINDPEEMRAVDVFALLILHSLDEQKKLVESILRNKITSHVITSLFLKEVFAGRSEMLEDFFKSIMQLASTFMRSPQHSVINISCDLYKLSFSHFSSYCQQEIIGKLVTHIGSGQPSEIDLTLGVLLDFSEDLLDRLIPYACFINGILEYLDNLDLVQVRKLYQILGRLAFCSRHGSVTQDGLHIIVRKQLSSPVLRYQQLGVMGGAMMIMNLASNKSRDILNDTVPLSNPMSSENFQLVVDMLELIHSSISRSPPSMALFLEELAILVKSRCLCDKVQEWITDKITKDFERDYVADVENDQATNEGSCPEGSLIWTLQHVLDPFTPGEEGVAINLAPLVTSQSFKSFAGNIAFQGDSSSFPVWCLSSSFRLLQTCEFVSKDGNLVDIEAVLGCGLKLPKNFPDPSANSKEKIIHLHCSFLLANWFIELVNAFSGQTDAEMMSKVVKRLQGVIEIQNVIQKMIPDAPEYVPPPCNFYVTHDDAIALVTVPKKPQKTGKTVQKKKPKEPKANGKKKKGRKKKNGDGDDNDVGDKDGGGDDDENDVHDSLSETKSIHSATQSNANKVNKNAIVNLSLLSTFYRELDIQVFRIFTYTKLTSPKLTVDSSPELENITLELTSDMLVFLLEDLLKKVSHCMSGEKRRTFLKTKSSKTIGFRNLDLLSPGEIVRQVCDLLPHMCRYLESLNMFFQLTTKKADETCDESCFDLDEHHSMTRALSLFLQIFTAYFSWPGFQDPSNGKLFSSSLFCLSSRLDQTSASQVATSELFVHAFNYIEKFASTLQDITNAVHLVNLLASLSSLATSSSSSSSSSGDLRSRTGDIALGFLKKGWKEEKKKTDFNEALTSLIKSSFTHSSDIEVTIEIFIATAIPEFLESEDESKTFPTLNKETFPVFFRELLLYLNEHVKTITPGTIHLSRDENLDKLLSWSASVKIFHVLINLLKTFDSRNNLISALKYGKRYLDCFLRQCMPTMDILLTSHKDDIQNLFKTLQPSTRFLHHLCSHSKIKKDISLTNQVPQLKRTLEILLHRVKDMLNKNRCMGAFWLGNLKNRDLKGDEILSQTRVSSEEEQDDDDDRESVRSKTKKTNNKKANSKDDDAEDIDVDALLEDSGNDDDDDEGLEEGRSKSHVNSFDDSDDSISAEY